MSIKRRVQKTPLVFFILLTLSQINISCTTPMDPDKIFLKELNHFATAMQSGNEAENMASLRQMEQFSKRFPRNKYSDDAKFIVVMMTLAGQWKPELVRDFLAEHPVDKLENETLIRLEKIVGPDIYLPYEIYFLLPEAVYDAQRKDFKSAKEKNMRVLQAIDSGGNPKLQKLRPNIVGLISFYDAQLNRKRN